MFTVHILAAQQSDYACTIGILIFILIPYPVATGRETTLILELDYSTSSSAVVKKS
jgi:hypothetical protein